MKKRSIPVFVLIFMLLLSACGPAAAPQPTAEVTAAPTDPPPTPTPTAEPERVLTICLGQEPTTLYRYGSSARAMWSVLEAVYDGPIDTAGYRLQPVILQDLPTPENGGVEVQAVAVQAGDQVVDVDGSLITLEVGARVYPAGCTGPDCAITWDGQQPLEMDQVTLRYSLLPGLLWSDGQPLTAADSVYSFQISADPATPVSRRQIERTADYRQVDETTVEWVGKPGYHPDETSNLFWAPLPEHAWSGMSAGQLLTSEESTTRPLGWGPYMIESWTRGEQISLVANPNYFRASEGLPRFDRLVFRFLGEQADNNLNALLTGACDIVDQTTLLEDNLAELAQLRSEGRLQVLVGQGPEWEQLNFGIRPALYDAGYNMYGGYRQDILSDARLRQAFAHCLDREGLIESLLAGFGQAADALLPADHPLRAADLPGYPYDPARGAELLEQAGWVDHDGDPATPRQASGIPTVLNGTPLSVELLTTNAPQRQASAQYLAENLRACGVDARPRYLTSEELYASGPQGPLFGRQFDLAQFAWQASTGLPCFLFTSEQVPDQGNNWLGVNISGFASEAFDRACAAATSPGATDEDRAEVQRLFNEQLPAIPLYYHLKLAAARPDLCGLSLDTSARSEFANIEALDYGEGCQQ